LDDGIGEAVIL